LPHAHSAAAVKDDLLVADPTQALVLRDEALPPHPFVAEFGEGPAKEAVVGATALEPDLVVVLARDQVHGNAMHRSDEADAPAIDFRAIGAYGRAVLHRRLPWLPAFAPRGEGDLLVY